ncbi:MAG: pyruvate kinase [Deltaproteobacteria bacterium]|jgi:pyruvate kinase|nr:pyruvate kinase [Deltaproteobacteria bacterium]
MPNKLRAVRPLKRTKIVATLGPASDKKETLRRMILAGMDAVRVNFSHSTHDYLVPLVKKIRALGDKMGVPIAIIGDLQGPRIRIGEIAEDTVALKTGRDICLTPRHLTGNKDILSVSYLGMADDVHMGSLILVDDGNIELEVIKVDASGDVCCRILKGGVLSGHRGINLPGLRVNLPSITQKDYADIDFAISQNFDFLALSFVQSAEDVHQLKDYLKQKKSNISVIAKIERQNALEDIEAISLEARGVMVARGDLALEMSLQEVPIAQKRIIDVCRRAAIPVITATQMLESMVDMRKPTRAEVADVANAILDGTDALMLSAETAIGKHPIETVTIMSKITVTTENAWFQGKLSGPTSFTPPQEIEPTVAYAGNLVAESLSATAIVAYTASGLTACRVACHRPHRPVLSLSAMPQVQRRLALTWGVDSALIKTITETDNMVEVAVSEVQRFGIAASGDTIVIIAGTPPHGQSGRTNTLKVERIP